jgi:hypothetical protein
MQRQQPSIFLIAAVIVCAPMLQAVAQTPPAADQSGPNKSIARRASGVYRYESIKDGHVRGEERWQFFAHPDGSRTLMMWHDLTARDAQFTVVLRVESSFRPIDAFVSYWNAGQFKGSAQFHIAGNRLLANSFGPYGARQDTIAVPARFSIGTHPVAGDGWHTWTIDSKGAGTQSGTIYGLEASTDLAKPVLGTLQPLSIERIGPELVTVPAGQFATIHYRVAGLNDLWITEFDRLVVKSVIGVRDLQYVLIETAGDLR